MSIFSEQLWHGATSQPYPAPGDVLALATVVSVLHGRRDAATQTHDQLHAIGSSVEIWDGEAAATFRGTVGKLLPHLRKASDSFGSAGDAIAAFRAGVIELQGRADALRPSLHEAEVAYRAGRADRWSLDMAVQLEQARARDALAPLLSQVATISGEYEALVRRCVSQLEDASHAGIRNSWGTFLPAHAKGLEQISHWSDVIAEWSGDLEVITTVAAAILAATGVGAPVAAGLLVAGRGFAIVNKTASVVRLLSDVGLASAQRTTQGGISTEKKWDLGEDVFSVVVLTVKPGGRVVDGVADRQIAGQVNAGRAALAAKDMPAFREAYENAGRVLDTKKLIGPTADKLIDKRVEDLGPSVRETFGPTENEKKSSAPCP